MKLEDHPTIRHLRALERTGSTSERGSLSVEELKELARACGADDVELVEINRAEFETQRDEILRHYTWTRSLLSIAVKMAQEPVRGTPRDRSPISNSIGPATKPTRSAPASSRVCKIEVSGR